MERLGVVGVLVVLAGFSLIFAGAEGQGDASAGGVILIGPIPIVFGTGPNGWPLALASLAIGIVIVALVLIWSFQFSRARRN